MHLPGLQTQSHKPDFSMPTGGREERKLPLSLIACAVIARWPSFSKHRELLFPVIPLETELDREGG